MRTAVFLSAVMVVSLCAAGTSLSQEPIIYPKDGQSAEQVEKDKYTCYSWAKEQSGFDPMQAPTVNQPSSQGQSTQGGAVRGAARGALVGVTVGAIAGDAGKGAAIGAASGGLLGGMRSADQRRSREQAEQQRYQQQQQAYNQKKSTYDRAFGACMEARGYTIR